MCADISFGRRLIREWNTVMALAVPWGALADRIGRKKVLAVNFLGCALHVVWFLIVCKWSGLLVYLRRILIGL